ncbi:mandelate racemase/muconate lactonizing enzyme family protein, partial [bacterium]|nr:mandelate racemase/muconate lactonizing enzyme family protein [bacterium]
MSNRRTFLQSAASLPFLIQTAKSQAASSDPLLQAKKEPVLKLNSFPSPIIIDSIELFRTNNEFFVKTTSTDGAVGVSITNNRASYLYPILDRLVIPHFQGKDARDLESLIDSVYLFKNNYKIAGLALWCPVAWVEMSILDMLGQIANKPVGELFGGIIRREIPIYCASGNRHTSPQDEAKILANLVEKTGAKAVKFKVGGRMSKDTDSIPGRSEALIPLARQTLGDDIAIHADSNGSYGVKKAIEIGKRLQDINAIFFEEPCEFDHLEETKQVADALKIPV